MFTHHLFTLSLAAVCLTSSAFAASRFSASYLVPADTADAGGRRATSVAYTHDGSIGGIAGVGTAAVPVEMARHGYISQLYDVASLALSASPTPWSSG